MAERRIDLERCRILISNDDGIASPGIRVLEAIARDLSDDVWVVAPEQEQSGASHSLTTRHPLRIREVAPRRYWVDGTPTDCVLIAVKRLLHERPPDLVLSGINAGSNVGEDLTYSGTVAAAMEATLLGIPAMALSQDYRGGHDIPWQTGEAFAPEVIRRCCACLGPTARCSTSIFPPCRRKRPPASRSPARADARSPTI
jgi:5'-nucleotidase